MAGIRAASASRSITAGGGDRSASPAPRSMTSTPRAMRSRFFSGIPESGYSGRLSRRSVYGGTIGSLDGVAHAADTWNLYLDDVAGGEGAHSRRRSCCDDVPGLQCHDARDVGEEGWD